MIAMHHNHHNECLPYCSWPVRVFGAGKQAGLSGWHKCSLQTMNLVLDFFPGDVEDDSGAPIATTLDLWTFLVVYIADVRFLLPWTSSCCEASACILCKMCQEFKLSSLAVSFASLAMYGTVLYRLVWLESNTQTAPSAKTLSCVLDDFACQSQALQLGRSHTLYLRRWLPNDYL